MYFKVDIVTGLIIEASIGVIAPENNFLIIESFDRGLVSNYQLFKYDVGNEVFIPITNQSEINPLYLIDQAYLQHENEGVNYFRKKRAELVLLYKTGQLTAAGVYEIEEGLSVVKSLIMSGDWMSGLNNVNTSVVNGAYTQELKDIIIQEITDYITNNY